MVGLRQILHVMQRQAGEAPTPIGVASAKRQRRQAAVLVGAQHGEGAFEEGRRHVEDTVLVVETHVKRRLRGKAEFRVAKGQGAKAVNLAPVRRAVAPHVDIQPVIRFEGGAGQHLERRHHLTCLERGIFVRRVSGRGQGVDVFVFQPGGGVDRVFGIHLEIKRELAVRRHSQRPQKGQSASVVATGGVGGEGEGGWAWRVGVDVGHGPVFLRFQQGFDGFFLRLQENLQRLCGHGRRCGDFRHSLKRAISGQGVVSPGLGTGHTQA